MTVELYPGYFSLGGNEIINNPRTRGILESLDCAVQLLQGPQCPSLKDALTLPYLSPWVPAGTNLATNPSFETVGEDDLPVGVAAVIGTATSSTEWAAAGERSVQLTATTASVQTRARLIPYLTVAGGETYTITATIRLDAPQPDGVWVNARTLSVYFLEATALVYSGQAPNEAGAHEIRFTVTVPEGTTNMDVRANHGGAVGTPDVWFDALAVVQVPSEDTPYGGPYFDGSTTPEDGLEQYIWDGEPDASTSQRQIRTLVTAPDYMTGSVANAPWYDLDAPDVSGAFYGIYAIDVKQMYDSTREADVAESILNGGTIGRMRLATREVVFTAVLFAENSAALEYGRTWLESATLPGACGQHGDACGTTDLEFFVNCPPDLEDYPPDGTGYDTDVYQLVRYLHNVEVTSGPTTVEEYRFANNLVAQQVEFIVTSERPWIYGRTRPVSLPTTSTSVVQDTPYNFVPYPSAEIAGANVIVARNLSANPSVETNNTGWGASAAVVSGTSPAAYFTSGRVTELAAVGTASERARILGNGSTVVTGAVSRIVIYQDVTLSAGVARRFSFNIWAAAIIAAGNAASTEIQDVKVDVEWRTASASVSTVPIGQAATASERSGRPYSARALLAPDTATIARVIVTYVAKWGSSATPASNSDVRMYADALAVTVP